MLQINEYKHVSVEYIYMCWLFCCVQGWFLGNVVFLVFQSADFSNKYIRPLLGLPAQPIGVITVDSKLTFSIDETKQKKQ